MANANGVSEYVAAAICANFWYESGVNPGVWQGLQVSTWDAIGDGYGLGQWTNTQGSNGVSWRLRNLHDWLSTNGFDDDDGDAQLEYITVEDSWGNVGYNGFNSLSDFLSSTSDDLAMLTHTWNWCWEGIHDGTWESRATQSFAIYNYIIAHYQEEKTWIKGNRYLNPDERYNNCILVFQGLGGHVIGRQGMPLYMMTRKRFFPYI